MMLMVMCVCWVMVMLTISDNDDERGVQMNKNPPRDVEKKLALVMLNRAVTIIGPNVRSQPLDRAQRCKKSTALVLGEGKGRRIR
eukprot:5507495-Pyramimonas_sp.AAC.1